MTHRTSRIGKKHMDPWKFMDDEYKMDRDGCLSDSVCKGTLQNCKFRSSSSAVR